ncbi:MAG: hypothetical protein K5785_00960 [Nitrosarchaeum sp.]|nr:hypothetical protein [Nitrosarchaeum sp.]
MKTGSLDLSEIPPATQAEAEAGILDEIRHWTPERIAQAIATLAGESVIQFIMPMWVDGLSGTNTRYYSLVGEDAAQTSESNAYSPAPYAGTAKKIIFKPIFNNSAVGSATVTLRKNGVDTALTVTVPAGSTTIQSLETDVELAEGDLLTIEVTGISGHDGSMRGKGWIIFEKS